MIAFVIIFLVVLFFLPKLSYSFGKFLTGGLFEDDEIKPLSEKEFRKLDERLFGKQEHEEIATRKPPRPKRKPKLTLDQAINKITLVNQRDDFEGTISISFNNIIENNQSYVPMYFEKISKDVSRSHIGMSFSIFEENIYLDVCSFFVSEMGLAKGDKLIIIFDGSRKLSFEFKRNRSSGRDANYNSCILNISELKMFTAYGIYKWKLISSRRNVYIMGDNTMFHDSCNVSNDKKIIKAIIKYLAFSITNEYVKKFGNIKNNRYK